MSWSEIPVQNQIILNWKDECEYLRASLPQESQLEQVLRKFSFAILLSNNPDNYIKQLNAIIDSFKINPTNRYINTVYQEFYSTSPEFKDSFSGLIQSIRRFIGFNRDVNPSWKCAFELTDELAKMIDVDGENYFLFQELLKKLEES